MANESRLALAERLVLPDQLTTQAQINDVARMLTSRSSLDLGAQFLRTGVPRPTP
jgi:hypothetical protein